MIKMEAEALTDELIYFFFSLCIFRNIFYVKNAIINNIKTALYRRLANKRLNNSGTTCH